MRRFRPLFAAVVFVVFAAGPVSAAGIELNCGEPGNVEEFRYTWRLRGGLSWVAGIMFPRSGVGNLKTTFPKNGDEAISSELLITPTQGPGGGFYAYESQMDGSGEKTLMTYHGYAWGKKSRKERTIFDYVKRLARIRKETPTKIEEKVKLIPPEELRDILTAIYYLRRHAGEIRAPQLTTIYSDGKEYPVIFRPAGRQTFSLENQRISAIGVEIVDAPGGKKWPGGVKLWLSDDGRRIPLRIEIQQSVASLQLDLKSIEACGFMQARR